MTYEIYRFIFIGGAVMSLLMLVVTILLFVTFKIPHIIGDLTGANARKAIEEIRSRNEETGVKTYKSSKVNRDRGRLTDKITPSGRIAFQTVPEGSGMRTEKIETAVLAQQPQQSVAYYPQSDETSLLMEEDPQAELECTYSNTNTAGETTVLNTGGSPMYGQTVLLEKDPDQIFEIEFEIAYLHSEVLIE